MTKEIEERILSMKFDNEQFEKNIQQSTNSLKTLDMSIRSASKDINKNLNQIYLSDSSVRNIEKSLSTISSRFSTMGIVGMTVVQDLTRAMMGLGKSIWNNTIGQIKAGGMKRALNIEQSTFLLEGLKLDVEQIKEDAMYAVEGTAYGFDEASRAAASFGASGVKAGDDMKQALLGVSGVAAMTGRDYQSIADIFTTIASNGKLMTMQLRQFSASGLNVSAALAKYLHKTEQEINEMVTKGQIDFATFAKAMNDTFGEHAKDANKTFTGSMSNMKAALSRVGEAFATPYIENMIPIFNKLKDVINDVKKALGPIIDDSASLMKTLSNFAVNFLDRIQKSGAIADIVMGIRHILLGLVGVLAAISKALREIFPNLNGIPGLFRQITLYLVPTRESFEKMVETFKKILLIIPYFIKGMVNLVALFISIIPKVKNFAMIVLSIILNVVNTLRKSVLINTFFEGLTKGLNAIKMVLFSLISVFLKVREVALSLMDKFDIIPKIQRVSEFLAKIIENLDFAYVGFASSIVIVIFALMVFGRIMKTVVKPIRGVLNLFKSIVGVFTSIGKFFTQGANTFMALQRFISSMQKAMVRSIAADILLKLAVAIAVLSVSLKLLSTIPFDKLIVDMGVVMLLIASLSIFTKFLNELDTDKKQAKGLLALAFCIGILTICLKSLSEMDWEQWRIAVSGLGSIVTFVLLMQYATSKLESMNTKGFFWLALSVGMLTASYKAISSVDWEGWRRASVGMGTVLVFILFMQMCTSKLENMNTVGFVWLAISVNMLTAAYKTLGNMNWDQWAIAAAGMGTILVFILFMQMCTSKLENMNTVGFVWLAISINLLTVAYKSLGNMSWEQWRVATIGMGTVLVFVLFMQMMTSKLENMKTTGFIFLAVSINLLTIAYKALSKMNWEQWGIAAASMGTILVFILLMQKCTSQLDSMKTTGFIWLGLSINLLAIAYKALGQMNWEQWGIAAAGMGTILVFILLMQKCTSALANMKTAGFLILAVCIDILVLGFKKLGQMDWEQWRVATAGMGVLLAFIFLVQRISANTSGINVKGLLTVAVVASILVSVMTILRILTALPMNAIMVAAATLAAIMLAISMSLRMMSGINSDFKSLLNLAASVGALIAIAYALNVVSAIPSEDLVGASTAISILFVALGLGLRIMNGSGSAVEILAASVSIIALAYALKIVAELPANNLISAAIAIGILVAALVGLGALAGIPLITAGLGALAVALAAVGAAAIGFGVAAFGIASAFEQVTNTIVELSSMSEESVQQLLSNLNTFISGLGDLALALAAQSPKFVVAISSIISAAAIAIVASAGKIAIAVVTTFTSCVKALVDAFPILLEALGVMLIEIAAWFESHDSEVYDIGFNIGRGLTNGIIGGLAGISDAIYGAIDDALFHSAASEGVMEAAAQQTAATYSANLTKWFNYYDAGTVTAEQLIEGMRIGLENGMYTQEEVMRELAQRGLEGYEDELGIHSPSLEMIKNGEYTIAGVIEGIHNGEYTFTEVMAALGENGANAFMSQFSGVEGLMGQLNSYALGAGTSSGTNWRSMGSHMAGYDSNGNMIQAWQREGFKSIDEYIEYHQTEEFTNMLRGWAGDAEEATEETEDLDETVDDLTKSLGDYSGAAGTATKETDKLKDSVKSALDIFSGFDAQLDLTAKDVLRSFSDQLTGVTVWAEELKALAGKGIATELIEELAEAGPKAIDQIHALYSMSSEELALFNHMYGEKLSLEASTADEIRKSFQNGSESIAAGGEAVGKATGNAIAEGTKAGTEQAVQYIEQFIDDGQKAGDIIDMGYDDRGFKRNNMVRFRAEGYDSAIAWEEAHKKACTKMVPVITQAYGEVAEAASDNVKTTVAEAAEVSVNEMEQGVKDAYKLGYEFQYVNGVIIPDGIKDSIKEATPGIAAIFGEMGYQSMDAFKHMLNVEDAMTMVASFQATLEDSITSSLKLFDEVKEKEDISAEEMLHRMKENVKNIGKWANDLQTLAARGISEGLLAELQELGPEGADKVRAFTKMTDEQLKQANQAFAASLELPSQVSDRITKSYAEAGFNTTLGFIDGIDPTAAEEVMTALGTYSLAALQKALDIHSPSKATMELGMYTVAGLVEGIVKGTNDISDAGTEMGSALLESLASAPEVISAKVAEFFGNLGDILLSAASRFRDSDALFAFNTMIIDMLQMSLDDISFEPTITPVIDLSKMDFGALNNALNGFSLTPSLSRANDISGNRQMDYSPLLRDITTQLKETRADVVGIRSDISRLDNAMSNMKVDMDGQSVGRVVTPYVNQNLGQSYVNSKRRSMR